VEATNRRDQVDRLRHVLDDIKAQEGGHSAPREHLEDAALHRGPLAEVDLVGLETAITEIL